MSLKTSLKEKRNRSRTPSVEPDLLEQGIAQLTLEIRTLKDWIADLDNDPGSTGDTEPRKSYEDMLRSRHEMLVSLQDQKAALNQQPTR